MLLRLSQGEVPQTDRQRSEKGQTTNQEQGFTCLNHCSSKSQLAGVKGSAGSVGYHRAPSCPGESAPFVWSEHFWRHPNGPNGVQKELALQEYLDDRRVGCVAMTKNKFTLIFKMMCYI